MRISDWSSDVCSSDLVPLRSHGPVGEEAELAQRLAAEARTDRTLGHANDGLPDVLVGQLVEGDEHQRARFARGRRGLDQQVLLAALLIDRKSVVVGKGVSVRVDLVGRRIIKIKK